MIAIREPLTGLAVSDLASPIRTFDQLGGQGIVTNKALAIPQHLGGPWRSLEYVVLPPLTRGTKASVGLHVQTTDELYYIHRGTGRLTTNGVPHVVEAGALAMAPTGTWHSIENTSATDPLGILVVELASPAEEWLFAPHELHSLPALLETTMEGFHPALIGQHPLPLRVASVEVGHFCAAPYGRCTLVELPAGGRIEPYVVADHDEVLFVAAGNATIVVAEHRFDSEDDGLSVVVPRGLDRRMLNRSMIAPLVLVSLQVRREGGKR